MLKVVVGFEPGIVKSTSFSDELAIRRTIVTSCAIFLYASCVLWTVQTLYELVLVIDMYIILTIRVKVGNAQLPLAKTLVT